MRTNFDGTWFLCTIGKDSQKNWDICKEHGLWGIGSTFGKNSSRKAVEGDNLIFYLAGKGFVGVGKVTSDARPPIGRQETPWAGSTYKYKTIIPFKLVLDCLSPVAVKFTNMKIDNTAIHTSRMQKGFSVITNKDAQHLYKLMTK